MNAAPQIEPTDAMCELRNAWAGFVNLSADMEAGPLRQQMRKHAERLRRFLDAEPASGGSPLPADELARRLTAMTTWLEANQPDVFRRGIWDAIGEPTAARTPEAAPPILVPESYFVAPVDWATIQEAVVKQMRKASRVTDLDSLVNRFLSWPVPASVWPDGAPGKPGRTGTNLLSAVEAKEMLQHVLGLEDPEHKA